MRQYEEMPWGVSHLCQSVSHVISPVYDISRLIRGCERCGNVVVSRIAPKPFEPLQSLRKLCSSPVSASVSMNRTCVEWETRNTEIGQGVV